jgi:hypothetical protein
VYAITTLTTVLSDFYGIDTEIISVNYEVLRNISTGTLRM